MVMACEHSRSRSLNCSSSRERNRKTMLEASQSTKLQKWLRKERQLASPLLLLTSVPECIRGLPLLREDTWDMSSPDFWVVNHNRLPDDCPSKFSNSQLWCTLSNLWKNNFYLQANFLLSTSATAWQCTHGLTTRSSAGVVFSGVR